MGKTAKVDAAECEHMTEEAALALAGRIQSYWRETRGIEVRAWVERIEGPGDRQGEMFAVRSNIGTLLVGGRA